jgi:hypothetical protein
MKRHIPGLHQAAPQEQDLPDGFCLVQVARVRYRGAEKPYLSLDLVVQEPSALAGREIAARLYCTVKALWKLNWFLRDFGYDFDRLERDEVEEKAIVGLRGVAKVSHTRFNGRSYINLDGFAPADSWSQFELEKAG